MARILLVDDEAGARRVIRRMLESANHEVTEAPDGTDALKQFADGTFDLVIMDLIMPGKEGIETIIEMRRARPETRVLAISGGGQLKAEGLLDMAGALGATGTLTKPFTSTELAAAVAQVLTGG